MHQTRGRLELRTGIEQRLHSSTVAEQKEFDVGMAAERQFSARNDHCCPMVTPHGVERNADFVGHGTTIPCGQESQQGGGQSPLVAALPFFQRSERRKWMRLIVADSRALERGIWLARIRIEAEDQKFGRNRAEID